MNHKPELSRPYLVIPKLVEQPTWGGQYIVSAKGWDKHENLHSRRIGQSYELFSGSNLSLLSSTQDPTFAGELADRDSVAAVTRPPASIPLRALMDMSALHTLGQEVIAERGNQMTLLIKFTQALGNSFQVHIRDGVKDPKWKPKPESWFFFEPGLITLGVKPDIDWADYQSVVEKIGQIAMDLGSQVARETKTYEQAKLELANYLKLHNPWRFVNMLPVGKDDLVDLSIGGLHHSWEEDGTHAPKGNVLYELQAEALDSVSTFRNFDKGKMEPNGDVRPLQIKEYFNAIDQSPEHNDPTGHMRKASQLVKTDHYTLSSLLRNRHYNLDQLKFANSSSTYGETITRYKHIFVKSGGVKVSAGSQLLMVTAAHSFFIPAATGKYSLESTDPNTELLISY